MNRAEGGQSQGYTIVETLIFLAVSAAMFMSAAAFINGKQGRAEFSSGVRDFESSVRDIANDVASGYYTNTLSNGKYVQCDTAGGEINISTTGSVSNTLGKNKGCIFIGKVLQLAPSYATNDALSSYGTIPLVGRQFKGADAASGYSENYEDSRVKAIEGAKQSFIIPGRPNVACAFYLLTAGAVPAETPCSTAGAYNTAIISFMTKFQSNSLNGGSSQVDVLVPKSDFDLQRNESDVAETVKTYRNAAANAEINPVGGVYICLQSTASNQYALLKIGGQGSQFSTDTVIKTGKCS